MLVYGSGQYWALRVEATTVEVLHLSPDPSRASGITRRATASNSSWEPGEDPTLRKAGGLREFSQKAPSQNKQQTTWRPGLVISYQ